MEVLGLSNKVKYTEFANLKDFLQAIRQADEYQIKTKEGTRPPTLTECRKIITNIVPKEKFFQAKIINFLKRLEDCFVWKEQAGYGYQISGLPDVCCIIGGRFFGFEVKRPFIGKVSPIQRERMEEIRKAGGVAEVVSYVDEVKAILESEGVHG